MTSTSSEPVVLRDLAVGAVGTADTENELRDGAWTRFGGTRVLGDRATETTLRGVAERSHHAARAQGFAAGWAEGQRASLARSTAARDEQMLQLEDATRLAIARQEAAASALAGVVLPVFPDKGRETRLSGGWWAGPARPTGRSAYVPWTGARGPTSVRPRRGNRPVPAPGTGGPRPVPARRGSRR